MKDKTTLLIILLILAIFIFFGNTLNFFFSQDDLIFLAHAKEPSYEIFLLGSNSGFIRPVSTTWYFSTLHSICGLNSFCFHSAHILIHIINSIIIYLILKKIVKKEIFAFIGALFFAINYINYYPLSWLSGAQELITFTFISLSFLFILNYFDTKKRKYHLLSIFLFFIAIFSKEIVILYSGTIFFLYFMKNKITKKNIKKSTFISFPFMIISIFYIIIWFTFRNIESIGPYSISFSIIKITINYLKILFGSFFFPVAFINTILLFIFTLGMIMFSILYYCYSKKDKPLWKKSIILFISGSLMIAPSLIIPQHTYVYYGLTSMIFITPLLIIAIQKTYGLYKPLGFFLIILIILCTTTITILGINQSWNNPFPKMQAEALSYKESFQSILPYEMSRTGFNNVNLINFSEYDKMTIQGPLLIKLYVDKIKEVYIDKDIDSCPDCINIYQKSHMDLYIINKSRK